ncbi:aldehyde dehydrogenase family protein [Aliagarivorans marinus]|uniref:aldehyde dehydrogenase family protein n=1 Tax=Aliagarivorans marinus TaxID=561965 RepID=UPI00042982D6|nr:aldehyde dehydrogenase family protein [Aliagarivorans marinus]
MEASKLYIGGELVEACSTHQLINPATDQPISDIFVANKEHALVALELANKAQQSWGKSTINERSTWMLKLRDALANYESELRLCVMNEMGKTWKETQEDFDMLIHSLEYYAEEIKRHAPEAIPDIDGTHRHTLSYRPIGVVVAYLAWNFPLLNLAYKIGPAMAAGCPIILKPSIKSPLSAYLVGAICHSIGLPAGAVNVLAATDREVNDVLSSSKIPAMLTLIGSTQTGMKVMQAGSSSSIKRYSMELGGNAPFIVCKDADLDLAADILTALKYGNCGQICVTPNRVLVDASVYPAFKDKVIERTNRVVLGTGTNSPGTMGCLVDKGARDNVHSFVEDAITQGGSLLLGGGFDETQPGAFYPPTVIEGLNTNMKIFHEEVFGPVICMATFDSEQEAVEIANNTEFGLASYVFTNNKTSARNIADQLEFGEIQINGVKYHISLPHVGIKQSGIGCDCSAHALTEYLYLIRETEALL